MQQIYRRTPTLKCDFNKVALQLWRYASVTSLTTIDMCQGWAFVEMELLVKIESGFQPMTIFTKSSILEVWKGSEYASKCNRWILIYYSAVSLPVFESDISRNSHPEVFLEKGVLKICSKFTGEHPCQSVISIKLLCNFIEITLRHGCSPVNSMHIFRTPFLKNPSGRLLLHIWHYLVSNKNLWKNINNIPEHNYFYVFH